ERRRFRLRIEELRQGRRLPELERETAKTQEEPPEPDKPVEPIAECAELLGQCLWDIFSDNHEVRTAEGKCVDLGSFRSSERFIADFWEDPSGDGSPLHSCGYFQFNMGTIWSSQRADLSPVYALIFRRLRSGGLEWRYVHPHMFLAHVGTRVSEEEAAFERQLREAN
ncbi:MAG: hypothetical protein ABIR36_00380, partial [Nitrospiraceae bacterium]